MLNYSAIIQAIIKQYKKHTKYVFSLLLLSVFVVSVVCSALTKPAISMTNEMDSQLALQFAPQNEFRLMNLKGAAGGLETINVPYNESIFKNYMSDTAGKITDSLYLGVATRFHLFAFDTVTINVHCNGNIVTPKLISQANYGTNQIRGDGVNDNEISIVTNSFSGNYNTIDNYMLFGSGMNVSYSYGNYSLNGNSINTPNVYKVTDNFIDISDQKTYYKQLSKDLSGLTSSTNDIKYVRENQNTPSITITNESADSAKILNLTASQLFTCSNGNTHDNIFQIYTSNVSPIIINVDMSGYGSDVTIPFELLLYVNNTQIPISEANVANGTNILWNFYDSSASDKNYTGKITTNKAFKGCILAPNASVETKSNIDGNIIANTIKTGGESHNVMFMTPYTKTPPIGTDGGDDPPQTALIVKKEWNNCTASGDIYFDLYRSHTQVTDGSIPSDAVKIFPNSWCGASASWQSSQNVDASDNGNPWYYYAKEISVNAGGTNAIGDYDVTYSGNGSTSSGTITITNTPKGSSPPPDEKINIEVTKQWNMSGNHPTFIAYSLYRSKTYQSSGIPNEKQSVFGNYQYIGDNDSFHAVHLNLDKYDSGDNQPWYYYVEETAVEATDGSQGKLSEYDVTYSNNGLNTSGTIKIINSPKDTSPPPDEKITINVTKEWSDGYDNHTDNAVLVYLKESSDNINWDYTEQSIMLSSENNWQGSFTDIPKNDKYYRVEEAGAFGYAPSYSKDSIKASDANSTENITITNTKEMASLTVKKIWQDVDADDLSHDVESVNVSVYRNKVSPTRSCAPMKSVSPFSLMSSNLLKAGNNTETLPNAPFNFGNRNYINDNYEFDINMNPYIGRTVKKIEVQFSSSNNLFGFIICGKVENNAMLQSVPFGVQYFDNAGDNRGNGLFEYNNLGFQIESGYYLAVSSTNNPSYNVQSIKITFDDSSGGGSGGGGSGGGSSGNGYIEFDGVKEWQNLNYISEPNEVAFDLSQYANQKITKIEVEFDTLLTNDTAIKVGYIQNGKLNNKFEDYIRQNNSTYSIDLSTDYRGLQTISENDQLILGTWGTTAKVKNVKVYLENYSPPTTTSATTTTTTTTTTAAPLQQPGGRNLPSGCECYKSVTLNAENNWQYTLSNLDTYADNKLYEYYIIETKINLKSGAANTYRIYEYSLNDGLALLPDTSNETNVLSVTNIYNTSGFIMPSTGGVGADVYYHTGFIMMIASGGIYITFAFIRKRKSLMSLKE